MKFYLSEKLKSRIFILMAFFMSFNICASAEYVDEDGVRYETDSKKHTAAVYGLTSKDALIENLIIKPTIKLKGQVYTVTSIKDGAFQDATLIYGSLTLPESIETIGNNAFRGCSNLSGELYLPDNISIISGGAFYGCKGLTGTLKLPKNISKLAVYAFAECSGLTSIIFPEQNSTITTLEQQVFRGCTNLSGHLVLPNWIKTVGYEAFEGTGFDEITLHEGLLRVNESSFSNNPNLKKLHISSTVIFMGPYAFANSPKLNLIICDAITPPEHGEEFDPNGGYGKYYTACTFSTKTTQNTINGLPYSNADVYVPEQSLAKYKKTYEWKSFSKLNAMIYPESLTLDKTDINLKTGAEEILTAMFVPENTTLKNITWSSSDDKIATVDINGKVLGINKGSAIITAACGNVSAECFVNVDYADVSDITTDSEDDIFTEGIILHVDESRQINVKVVPMTASPEVSWSVQDPEIASIDNGKVTAVSEGTTVVTVSAGSFKKDFTVTVNRYEQNITWNQELGTSVKGETVELNAIASSGLEVEYSVITENAIIEEDRLTLDNIGIVILEASQPGDYKFLEALPVYKRLKVVNGETGLINVSDDQAISIDGNILRINDGVYTLFSLSGQIIASGRGNAEIPLQSNGTYILKLNLKTIKIIIK